VLDRLTSRGAVRKGGGGRLSVFYTEFGYQTNPPDPFAGIPLGRHNRYLQLASYIAWRTPRVRGINQFRLTDGIIYREPGPARYREFQSGLLFANRRKKPAFGGFSHPFVIAGRRFWGQVRPGGAHRVTIQERTARGRWRTIRRLRTDARGYFSTRARRRRGRYYRFLYDGAPAGKSNTLRIG
jgi:hypothetical protein